MEFRFTPALAGAVDFFERLIEKIEAVSSCARSRGENHYPCADIRPERCRAEIDEGRHSRPQDLDPASNVVRSRKHPTPIDRRSGPVERKLVFGSNGGELLGGFVERCGLAEDRVVAARERQGVGQGMGVGKLPRHAKPRADPYRSLLGIAEKEKGETEPHRCDGDVMAWRQEGVKMTIGLMERECRLQMRAGRYGLAT